MLFYSPNKFKVVGNCLQATNKEDPGSIFGKIKGLHDLIKSLPNDALLCSDCCLKIFQQNTPIIQNPNQKAQSCQTLHNTAWNDPGCGFGCGPNVLMLWLRSELLMLAGAVWYSRTGLNRSPTQRERLRQKLLLSCCCRTFSRGKIQICASSFFLLCVTSTLACAHGFVAAVSPFTLSSSGEYVFF